MRERGIIMAADSVRAILAGRKTQTRRVAKQFHANACLVKVARESGLWCSWERCYADAHPTPLDYDIRCPYGSPGDRLWVKEAWEIEPGYRPILDIVHYRADGDPLPDPGEDGIRLAWRSPLFMPRWASRLTLEVVEVRVQRVQEISEEDARADGLWRPSDDNPYGTHYVGEMIDRFAAAWDRINPKDPWASNPWVWAVSFRRVEAPR